MIVISANQLTKLYGIDEILTDVSFHINAGDRVGIVGANGAGKKYPAQYSFRRAVMRFRKLLYFIRSEDRIFQAERLIYIGKNGL